MAKTPIRNEIRLWRFKNNEMTQAELAGHIGVTRQTIAAIEKGKYSPTLEAAFRIAAALGAPFEEVFQYAAEEDAAFLKRVQKQE